MKVHADFRLFAAAHFDATQYLPSPAYGVHRFLLDRIGRERARATTIVQYQPNSHVLLLKFPEHTHIGGEEFIVLAGTFQDQYGAFPAGTYIRNPIGTKHAPWVDADGCTIFVKLLQMAESDDDTTPLHISLDQAQRESGKETEYGTVAELYSNRATGEVVEMCWMQSHAVLPYDSKCAGGEELFILSGSVQLADDTTYDQWGWLRFPPQSDINALKQRHLTAGPTGAHVYRKTGHLTDHALAMEKIQVNEDGHDGVSLL